MKIKNKTRALVIMTLTAAFILGTFSSCMGEVKEKLKKAKQGVSNVATVAEKAQEAKEDIERLKDAVPLTNAEMKEWLPEKIGSLQRTAFKVGAAGYANVASVEGTYKMEGENRQIKVTIIDGAGPSGSMMIAGLGMASKMDMEEETEHKHTKSVTVNGIRAQQTFHKKRNETALQFVFEKRFGVMVNGVQLDPDETWKMVEKLDLEELEEMTD